MTDNLNLKDSQDIINKLEHISLKLDNLSSISEVCSGAFVGGDSFSNLNPRSVHETFISLSEQLGELSNEVTALALYFYRKQTIEDDKIHTFRTGEQHEYIRVQPG